MSSGRPAARSAPRPPRSSSVACLSARRSDHCSASRHCSKPTNHYSAVHPQLTDCKLTDMTDFLEEKRREIQARLKNQKPLADEYQRLEAAEQALAGVNGDGARAAPAPPRAR